MANLAHQGDGHSCGHILMFDLWLCSTMRNSLPKKYLILRRHGLALKSVCCSADQRSSCRPMRGSEETSRDMYWDQQDLGCLSLILLDREFSSLSHYYVCGSADQRPVMSANQRPVFRSRDLSHYFIFVQGGGSGGAVLCLKNMKTKK